MIDHEPLKRWRDGQATLIGNAAHATYPIEARGANQAIVDARILCVAMRNQGVTIQALDSYETIIRPTVNPITRANLARQGPDATMQIAEGSCDGVF